MLFDSSALVIGLIASYMAEWPASQTYSFGYKRVEVLSGYINGVFLVFVGGSVALEAIERIREPPDVGEDQLMLTSVGGLIVNLIGIRFDFGQQKGLLLAATVDPIDLLIISAIVIVVSVLASLQPAFKASRMEPITALRHV